jgi:hypothetical protein
VEEKAQIQRITQSLGGFFSPGNNIFIGGGGETIMVGVNGNDQFFAGSNNLFDGGADIMIGGSGANYFDCGPNGNGVILDFNPAKGDTKSPSCKYVITTYSNNIFGPGIPDNITGTRGSVSQSVQNSNESDLLGFLLGQNSNANQPNNAGLTGGAGIPGLLSGQGSDAKQPNIAGIPGLLSGQGSDAKDDIWGWNTCTTSLPNLSIVHFTIQSSVLGHYPKLT